MAIPAETVASVLAAAEAEVLAGLPNEQQRIDEARINLDYCRGNGDIYIEQREGEDPYDFDRRPKRTSQITKRMVDVSTQHLFNPGPARTFNHPEPVAKYLDAAYVDVNGILIEADRASTLNEVALVQVAASGDPDSPIKYQVWDSSQFAVWLDPEDCSRVVAAVTIDRQDEQTRYTLWVETEYRVYLTAKLLPGQTNGGRVSELVEVKQNPYGCLPFVVCPYRQQCGEFWCDSPGTPVRKANAHIDQSLSDLGQAIQVHLFPVGVATNVADTFNATTLRPGKFVHIPSDANKVTGAGGAESKLGFVQAEVAVTETWVDIDSYANHVLEMEGIPKSAVRMEQSGTASGVAIVAEQLPLITRSKQRQPLAAKWEQALVKVVLQVGGSYYKRADLLAAAKAPKLTLSWPPVELPIPGPDQDNADAWELEHGLASPVDILMRRRGIGRDEAVAVLKRVRDDGDLLGPKSVVPTPPPEPPAPAALPSPTPVPPRG